ncbi:Hypothetical protein XNRR2_3659 [Streptomyces albidoflavus]|nr:Hypothetical protein XNR_3659 [Streptomyces albidoflavus]QLP93851.1 Hypothetical protein XNRR2_3659 [Streptomyces albidoflavus]WAE12186.1 Hypothetical protein SAD14_3659 [Streptomyces albidoflavus]WAE17826.1 Hypothetical protein SAD14N_3659 [Streptomyces albidoflavus]
MNQKHDDAGRCRTCAEWKRAEAVANAEHDWSRATDCRVLLRRHQFGAECPGRRDTR